MACVIIPTGGLHVLVSRILKTWPGKKIRDGLMACTIVPTGGIHT